MFNMRTLVKNFSSVFILLILVSSMVSCDGLVKADSFNEDRPDSELSGYDFDVEILVSDGCSEFTSTLVATSPNQTPIDIFNTDIYDIIWKGEAGELSDNYMLDCASNGSYKVNIINVETEEEGGAEITLNHNS